MTIVVNGQELTVPGSVSTVRALLDHLRLNKDMAIVEINQSILEKSNRDHYALSDGDRIEIVQFVGGG